MKKAVVKLDKEVIEMAGAQESKKSANKPGILTLSKEEEIGRLGEMDHHRRQKIIHVIPLGFSADPKDTKVQIAKRVTAGSRVKVGTYINGDGAKECCLVFKAAREANLPQPREMCGANPWTVQAVRNLWEGALDPFPVLDAWQKITRILGRAKYGYIVR
jgi:hypothetical protein